MVAAGARGGDLAEVGRSLRPFSADWGCDDVEGRCGSSPALKKATRLLEGYSAEKR